MRTGRRKTQTVYCVFKRLMDIVFSLIGLIFLSPLFLIVGFMVKNQDGGPVFFKQPRVGKNGKVFKLVKFRSMTIDNDLYNLNEEDKITKFGDFIRKTSIDELPQLWNILKGEMSFIGPRPWVKGYYDNMNNEQRRRHDVLPGITGLAQAKGRNNISIIKKIGYDLEYVDNISLLEDVKVFFLTIKTVITKDGVQHGKQSVENEIKTLKDAKEKLHKEKPLVSIIIPVYNAENFVTEAIETVLEQTYDNWELILVNDYSTDKSESVAKPFLKDRRIKWINQDKWSGAASCRNLGIKLAKGKFIAFLDADDIWKKNKLEKQVLFMLEKECEFSFTGYEFANANGTPNGKKVFVPQRISHRQALKNTTIFTSTVMFNLKKLSKNDIRMLDVPSEDTATWWMVLKKIPYAYGMNPVYSLYRRSENTLSSNKKEAIKRIWFLYREVEKLGLVASFFNFCHYAINAVARRA